MVQPPDNSTWAQLMAQLSTLNARVESMAARMETRIDLSEQRAKETRVELHSIRDDVAKIRAEVGNLTKDVEMAATPGIRITWSKAGVVVGVLGGIATLVATVVNWFWHLKR